MNDYAVMMLTCDAYRDIWPIFLGQLKKYWKDFSGTLFINTESDHSFCDTDIKIQYPNKTYDTKHNWAYRLKDCLCQVEEDYVLLILDDFALSAQVDEKEISKCLKYMKEHENVACFNYRSINGPFSGELKEFDGKYLLASRKADFRVNLQAALWRKKFLLKFIRNHENPWQFETWGSMRARRYKDEIYHLKKGCKSPISYPFGGIIADGKWLEESTISWLQEEGYIDIDYSRREIYHWGDARVTEIIHRTFFEKCWQVFKSLV